MEGEELEGIEGTVYLDYNQNGIGEADEEQSGVSIKVDGVVKTFSQTLGKYTFFDSPNKSNSLRHCFTGSITKLGSTLL